MKEKGNKSKDRKECYFFYFFPNNFKFCAVKKDYKDIQ